MSFDIPSYSAMQVLEPVPIDAARRHSTTATDATPAWVTGTTYAVGDTVKNGTRLYRRLAAGAGTKTPDQDPDNWMDAGPTNDWAMFDDENNTATSGPVGTALTVVLRPGQFLDSVYLGGLYGASATITLSDGPGNPVIYSKTIDLNEREIGDWYEYLFAPFRGIEDAIVTGLPMAVAPDLTISIDAGAGAAARCAMCAVGQTTVIGGTQWGASARLVSYSHIKTDAFGKTTRIKRHSAKTMRANVIVPLRDANGVQDLLARLDGRAALWSATPRKQYRPLRVFGLAQASMDFSNIQFATLDLEATGLI